MILNQQTTFSSLFRLLWLSIVLFLFFLNLAFSQSSDLNREDWIYWQKDRPLRHGDFKGEIGSCGEEYVADSIKMNAVACMAIWSVLDIPKSRKGGIYERFYFAPVVNTNKSWARSGDTIAILQEQVFFNINELAARWARRELYLIREENDNATGASAIHYETIRQKMDQFKNGVYRSYFDAAIRTQNLDSLNHWNGFIIEMLEKVQDYETREIEFERLVSRKSEKGFKKAKKLIGPLY